MAKGDCTRVRDDAQNISALQLKEQNMNSSYTRKKIKIIEMEVLSCRLNTCNFQLA